MSATIETATTLDHFLGGRLVLEQPARGYRAGLDPVLLAASCPAVRGQAVLDLGCGAGAVALCLAVRVAGLELMGIERQSLYADLARGNATRAGVGLEVFEADIATMPAPVKQRQFDHVLANPPYFSTDSIARVADDLRDGAHREAVELSVWFTAAAKRLRPRGQLHMIQRIERVPEMLADARMAGLGGLVLRPISGRPGQPPSRAILHATKDSRAPFQLLPELVLHKEARHPGDTDDFTNEISAILREGDPLV